MPIPCKISIDGGTPVVIATGSSVVLQGTNSSSKPTRLKRIQLQSNNTGTTQQIVTIQYLFYATGTAAGTTVTAVPVDEGLTGIYTPSTLFKANTATLGTTPTVKYAWQWNTANPFDIVEGLLELQEEIPVSKPWALLAVSVGTSFNLTGTVNFEEF